MSSRADRLFTRHFFAMFAFSFFVFLSAFQLFPIAPFHIRDLGGTTFASGMFLGFLTYASAFSAPLTGAFADRVGQRRILLVSSVALAVLSMSYALVTDYRIMLVLALVHGVFWSGLLSASAAYMTNRLPESRRAEGLGYWGLSTLAAISIAPAVGFWVHGFGWMWVCVSATAMNLVMTGIAWRLEDYKPQRARDQSVPARTGVEWRVLIVSATLALYSFGYGGITSFTAMYADTNGVAPKGVYLTTLALVILGTRPLFGGLGDRIGYRRVFVPCLLLISAGLGLLSLGGTRGWLLGSAIVFGLGFGTAYPNFVGYIMRAVNPARRGAAFGAILAAFDTGVGSGSTAMGWLIQQFGFRTAFSVAAAISLLAIPYFLLTDRVLGYNAVKTDAA